MAGGEGDRKAGGEAKGETAERAAGIHDGNLNEDRGRDKTSSTYC